jgi:thiosulfate/3-mercaptopyruvate sulfurtransferase
MKINKDSQVLIQPKELLALANNENLRLFDVRTGKMAQQSYENLHLAGAVFLDLNTVLAKHNPDPSQGGRHPLPHLTDFANTIGQLGIDETHDIVLYDTDQGANAAARAWWMLRALGHQKVRVLDGGLNQANKIGLPTTTGIEFYPPLPPYPAPLHWGLPLLSIDDADHFAKEKDHVLIDVRASERYLGYTEPIDLVAGHIPGAINIPFTSNLGKDGFFLSKEDLQQHYRPYFKGLPSSNVAIHCGSGVTACHTLLALAHAGFELPALYVGSWSEWSRQDRPIHSSDNVID